MGLHTLVVPPPRRIIALCPNLINCLIALNWTKLPACKASDVASNPI